MTGNRNFTRRILSDPAAAQRVGLETSPLEMTVEELIQSLRAQALSGVTVSLTLAAVSGLLEGSEKISAFETSIIQGDAAAVFSFIQKGQDINEPLPQSKLTPLQLAAGLNARDVVRVLIETDTCDHLLRDRKGRLASEFAFTHGRSIALARLLSIKERKQAKAQGIKLTRRP